MVKVRFLPVDATNRWDVMVGDRTLCTTPCEKWVDPAMPFSFKHDPGFWQRNSYIDIPDIREQSKADKVEVKATPRNTAQLVGGILITTFSGIAVATEVQMPPVSANEPCAGRAFSERSESTRRRRRLRSARRESARAEARDRE